MSFIVQLPKDVNTLTQYKNSKVAIMTVRELIIQLENCNPDAEVYIYTGDINLMIIDEVEQEAPAMVVIS